MNSWLLDCGNTRWKWAATANVSEVTFSEAGHIPAMLAESPNALQELIVLPTAAASVAVLEQAAPAAWRRSMTILGRDRPGCAGYATHGLDRQAGGFAVVEGLPAGARAIVLDAGTAITADVWEVVAGKPIWLGGWILPGSRVAMQGLAAAAPALPVAAEQVSAVTAATSAEQLAVGPQFGWPVMVDGLVRQLIAELPPSAAGYDLFLSGGDSAGLADVLQAGPWRLTLDPHLVLRGMLAWAGC